ncbi:MAG: hypothetical protein EBU88_07415 [Acidobacteria bacterium]|nr:hypothetical protein [Acidobacteriota bacterium]
MRSSRHHSGRSPHFFLKLALVAPLAIAGVAALSQLVGAVSGMAASGTDLPEGPGAEIMRRDCLSCHEADLIVSQRLTRAGWGRELDKMVRWGAVVEERERDPLIEFLLARH